MTVPTLSFNVAMGGENAAWQQVGDYALWTMHRPAHLVPLRVLTLQSGGTVELPSESHALNNIPAGTPHRIAPLFGFWRISGGDTDLFKVSEPERTAYSILINTGHRAYRNDIIAWFCSACLKPLAESSFDVRRFGLAAFWDHAAAKVAEFNASPALRTCNGCGQEHPPAYDFQMRDTAPW